jgi:transcriptional regulator with AAA-type ATPase domain
MLRLVAYAPDGVRRFPLEEGEMLIGSGPESFISLPYTGVAQRHALLRFDGERLRIEDLGSRKGILVAGKKVREATLDVLDEIRLGNVTLLVEDITPAPERAAPAAAAATGDGRGMTPERMISHLARISEWVLSDNESRTTSESLVGKLLADFGGGALFLLLGDREPKAGVKLMVASDPSWLGQGEELVEQLVARMPTGQEAEPSGFFLGKVRDQPAWVCYHSFAALDRRYTLIVAFPGFSPDGWLPIDALRSLGHLLVFGLVHHVGWYEPILPGQLPPQDLVLDPALVMGESAVMKRVLDQMRFALSVGGHVLLRGEAGVGKELIARSLHLSSGRRNGPFVVAVANGSRSQQLEAELFGAEVAGKGAPVRREGKLLLAHGGTFFLDEVDQLPLELQVRLVRFLRSGLVEPAGSSQAFPADVRIIAGSRVPLEEVVARELFRVDLAYRLSRFTIEVPPLRQRTEDLPLLIQSLINRFCHETGKRMQGITVKAMTALLNYDYPGNVAELENIIRQLVYLNPPGHPADINLLPERVRQGILASAARVDASSDLDLERLVGACEQAAIREALRRTQGNKSQAARVLGLSRNGLAIKMERYGLKG